MNKTSKEGHLVYISKIWLMLIFSKYCFKSAICGSKLEKKYFRKILSYDRLQTFARRTQDST